VCSGVDGDGMCNVCAVVFRSVLTMPLLCICIFLFIPIAPNASAPPCGNAQAIIAFLALACIKLHIHFQCLATLYIAVAWKSKQRSYSRYSDRFGFLSLCLFSSSR
jgi:hypothetical protein